MERHARRHRLALAALCVHQHAWQSPDRLHAKLHPLFCLGFRLKQQLLDREGPRKCASTISLFPLNSPQSCNKTGKLSTFQLESFGLESFGLESFGLEWPEKTLVAAAGSCDTISCKDEQCFKAFDVNAYSRSRAVIRATFFKGNDSILCTAWLWVNRSRIVSNDHCFSSQAAVGSARLEFQMEAAVLQIGSNASTYVEQNSGASSCATRVRSWATRSTCRWARRSRSPR